MPDELFSNILSHGYPIERASSSDSIFENITPTPPAARPFERTSSILYPILPTSPLQRANSISRSSTPQPIQRANSISRSITLSRSAAPSRSATPRGDSIDDKLEDVKEFISSFSYLTSTLSYEAAPHTTSSEIFDILYRLNRSLDQEEDIMNHMKELYKITSRADHSSKNAVLSFIRVYNVSNYTNIQKINQSVIARFLELIQVTNLISSLISLESNLKYAKRIINYTSEKLLYVNGIIRDIQGDQSGEENDSLKKYNNMDELNMRYKTTISLVQKKIERILKPLQPRSNKKVKFSS